MRSVIQRIFKDFQFEQVEIPLFKKDDAIFFANFNNDSLNFYLVLFVHEDEVLSQELQFQKYYNEIKGIEKGYDERMDKNLSMLVCVSTNISLRKENLVKKIFEIEENPYFFKKHVLSYTPIQSSKVSEYFIENEGLHSSTLINKVVNNSTAFISFKDEPNNVVNSLYNMCSKLIIKLPFVSFERGEKQIESLSKNLKVELLQNDLLEYAESLLDLEQNNNTYNTDEILKILSEGDKYEL